MLGFDVRLSQVSMESNVQAEMLLQPVRFREDSAQQIFCLFHDVNVMLAHYTGMKVLVEHPAMLSPEIAIGYECKVLIPADAALTN